MLLLSVLIFVIGMVLSSAFEELPKNYPVCSRNDPNLNQCLLDATNSVRDLFVKGDPAYGLLATAPLFLPLVDIEPDQHPTISFHAKLRNVTVTGLEKYNFKSFTYDPATLKWHADVTIPSIYMEGDAVVHGKVLVLQLSGESSIIATMENFNIITDLEGELIQRKGKEYFKIKNVNSKVNIGKGHLEFGEFKNNNKEIAATVTKVLQESNDEIFKMLKKPIQDFISQFVVTIFDDITKQVPYSKLLPVA